MKPTARYEGYVKKTPFSDLTKLCHVCDGHGAYNELKENQFIGRRHCNQCNGHGWVVSNSCENHNYQFVKKVGKYAYDEKCINCGVERTIDSSD
jgi:DnaJ-class molecular chaperone